METISKCALIYSLDGISQSCQASLLVLLGFCLLVTQAKTSKPAFCCCRAGSTLKPLTFIEFIISEALLLFPTDNMI